MSSSIAGLHAIASKPGQSLAPMIGWFVLRSAGYSTATVNVASAVLSEDTGRTEEGVTLRGDGEPAPTTENHDRVAAQGEISGAASGDIFDALLWLLIFLPGFMGAIQVFLWQAYRLHGVALGMRCAVLCSMSNDLTVCIRNLYANLLRSLLV